MSPFSAPFFWGTQKRGLLPVTEDVRLLRHDYEIEYRGRVIRCRTERALARALHVIDTEPGANDKRWTVDEFSKFTDRIRAPQRKLLQTLLEYRTAWLSQSIPSNMIAKCAVRRSSFRVARMRRSRCARRKESLQQCATAATRMSPCAFIQV
jgi:hypothetical protein